MKWHSNRAAVNALNLHSVREPDTPGTLLWIGQRGSAEFRDAFEHCQTSAAQIAIRPDLEDTFLRPAASVKAIVITRQTTQQYRDADLRGLARFYPEATIIQLLGSLCGGERPRSTDVFGKKTVYWHQWNQYLPQWLSACGVKSAVKSQATSSILIVANQHSSAEPLMDLASSAGLPTVWCKRPNVRYARNLSAVWWDDSAARPTTTRNWQHRINQIESLNLQIEPSLRCRHVWLASWPRHQETRAAIDAGIDLVISKPHEISLLSETIAQPESNGDRAQNNHGTLQSDHLSRAA